MSVYMWPEPEKEYEADLRWFIEAERRIEDAARARRQELEAKLKALLDKRGVARLKSGCPPAFAEVCVLEDGTRCPFYHDGLCVKAEEEDRPRDPG